MLRFGPDGNADATPTPPPPAILDSPREGGPPPIQPGDHLFSPDLGDGLRNRFTAEMLPGWQRPLAEMAFEMRQLTIAERCRAFRFATNGDTTDNVVMLDKMIEYTIRKIGDRSGEDLTDDFVHQWVHCIRPARPRATTLCSRSCTAPTERTARCKACSSSLAFRAWALACWAAQSVWTR